jgi:RNA polymerase sigma factor (sigma-70 family)
VIKAVDPMPNGLPGERADLPASAGSGPRIGSDELIPTRHSLLRRMKNSEDQASWEDFFDTYWKLIYGVAIKAGLTHAEAQDVVQETVVNVARNIRDFEIGSRRGSFKAWLLQNTRWRITDQLRKRLPHASRLRVLPREGSDTPTTERLPDPASLDLDAFWNADWQQNLVDAALANLRTQVDPAQYQMFDLHVLRNWPAAKVARELGVKMGRIYFAKYKIARLLKKEVRRLETKGV